MIYVYLFVAFLILWTALDYALKKWTSFTNKSATKTETILNHDNILDTGNNSLKGTVSIKNLVKIFPSGGGEIKAVDVPNLEINQGEFVSVVGRSGSGKTTLLNLIGGLEKTTSGTIYLGGVDIGSLKSQDLIRLRNQKIGIVFQEFNLMTDLTALENVQFPLQLRKVDKKESLERAIVMLENVGLKERIYHYPKQLSSGESQRVALARALVTNPDIVLADEPTGEVDTQTSGQIINIMKKLNSQLKTTFLIVTHDPAVAASTNRVIRIQDGQIISDQKNLTAGEEQLL